MEIEIRDITEDRDNTVAIIYFIPKGFDKKPLMGNCKYATLSHLTEIRYYEDHVELVSSITPVVKKIVCERLLILSDNPDSIVVDDDSIIFDRRKQVI